MNDDILNLCKELSSSVMDIEDISKQYSGLTLAKKHYLYNEVKKSIKELDRLLNEYKRIDDHTFNNDFECRIDLLIVDLNLIAINSDTEFIKLDPAVVLLSRFDKNNKKLR